ncbi:MAG: FeoA domain-containing protein [candidate division Zixibacteria bacterium]|nr:FeoA domain-containing protein [candidate division Zixibacteria bacterium]
MRFWGSSEKKGPSINKSQKGGQLHLSDARVGQVYTMLGLEGGHGIREKIYSMGLNPGVSFIILINSGSGPIEIEVRQTKLAIGRGMANKIRISDNGTPG